jgi:hypothetical protein
LTSDRVRLATFPRAFGSDFGVAYPRAQDVTRVVLNMRALSAAEVFASRADDDPAKLADEICHICNPAAPTSVDIYALGRAHGPGAEFTAAALLGCAPVTPDLGAMLWIATDDWPAIAIPTHRFWRRHFVPNILAKYGRIEILGGIDPASRRWCRSLGFTEEAVVYAHGKRGEDFIRFAWHNPDGRRRRPAA